MENRIYNLHRLIEHAPDQVEMLVDNQLPKVGLAGIIGETGIGKSTYTHQLAVSVAYKHEQFLGLRLNCTHHRALIVSTEDDLHNLGPKFNFMLHQLELDYRAPESKNLGVTNSLDKLPDYINQTLSKKKCDLVVIDAFSDLIKNDGNNASEVRNVLKPFSELASIHKCLFIIVHHMRKSGGSNPSKHDTLGSSAFEAKMRSLLSLQSGSSADQVVLKVLKANYLPRSVRREKRILEFKNLVFSPIDVQKEARFKADSKRLEADSAIEKALEILGENPLKKEVFEEANKHGYPYGISKFYKDYHG